jgi:NAD(P)-dependent dehydrogenase (short-subunit alcohol dehydrogenase family)
MSNFEQESWSNIFKMNQVELEQMRTRRTALITGASRGLGQALASALAKRGWGLILDARGQAALENVRSEICRWTNVIAIPGDVQESSHRKALAWAARQAGGLEAVINNASLLGPSPMPSLLKYPLEELENVFRVNVFSILALIQDLKAEIKTGGRIINVSSDAGVEAYPGWGGYGSSKAALEQLSAILAEENPQWRVYWVDPGDMRTQMHQEAFPGEDISDRPLPEETVPGFLTLLEGDLLSGRYRSQALIPERT